MESTALERVNSDTELNKVDGDNYDDDFEKETEENSDMLASSHKSSDLDDDEDVITSALTRITHPEEIFQPLKLTPGIESTFDKPSDTDSEPETDVYNFTEDQQRAMMELMTQKQEDADLLDEEPPEYNVKGRLEQLNSELANDPTPVEKDREHRVGFKSEIIDLVASPPPDYSDDESQPSSVRGELHDSTSTATPKQAESSSVEEEKDGSKENKVDLNKKQFVVERDGHFSLLSANELSPSERAIFINEDVTEKKIEKQSNNEKINDKTQSKIDNSVEKSVTNSIASSPQVLPRPPSWPRPNTASSATRRNVHLVQSLQAKSIISPNNSSSVLDNFNYNSPYAMTPEQKEEAREKARKLEEGRKENERKNKEESEERKRENDSAFQAWLHKKMEDNRKKQGVEGEKQKSEQELREENEEAYRCWLKEKKVQVKKEKLLKRRQQQEKVEGFVLRTPEESEEAFKEWLKKKNAISRKQNTIERQTDRVYRIHIKRSRKVQAIIKALKESQGIRHVDYYGYRF